MCVVSMLKVWFGRHGVARCIVPWCHGSTVCEGKMGLQVNTEGVLCEQQLIPDVICTQKTRLCLENRVLECWGKSWWFWDGWEVVEPV